MKRALLVVDMQNDYFPGGRMELVGIEDAAEIVVQLLSGFRERGLPVFHIQHIAQNPGATFFLPDTDGVNIHRSVAPQAGEPVVTKHFPNSFRETTLLADLQRNGIQELVVCGAMSHMCIDSTVRAGFDQGLSCIVVADGCATRNLSYGDQLIDAAQVQGAYMAALAAVFAKVTDLSGLQW
ncbi:cysteine hydrolase [Desulfopila sp. IMCC35006]|uniref:cysteine hydrolase family protein n=1 Tax=Desulfopila sp. IMCC35006 TaxID=2569542 RepID=UPI0010AC93F8|nr:cysteine hydrolase family protein [Desulfopila sp. IMCC35006]TKB28186.1 cysteine hydrolase [Desulfopila sp. IMCC35006]